MKNKKDKFRFASIDNRFQLELDKKELDKVLELCERSNNIETGGIFIGQYTDSHRCAVVTATSGPPLDSQRSKGFFLRGVNGLQQLIDRMWNKNQYYLGEWHYHPHSSPDPSKIDIKQIKNTPMFLLPRYSSLKLSRI